MIANRYSLLFVIDHKFNREPFEFFFNLESLYRNTRNCHDLLYCSVAYLARENVRRVIMSV